VLNYLFNPLFLDDLIGRGKVKFLIAGVVLIHHISLFIDVSAGLHDLASSFGGLASLDNRLIWNVSVLDIYLWFF
jgi:hypothetical protein